jgi:hypothetical protein
MSKLARVLAVGALLTAMSLASAAHAQDGDAPSQQAGITQSDPSQPQPPGEIRPQSPGTPEEPGTPEQPAPAEEPGTPEELGPPEEPAPAEEPGTTPGSTTTTRPPVVQPESLPVTVSPRTGGPGTTVTVRADLRGCTRPGSAQGFFLDRLAYGVDGASRRLVREHVAGGRWYSAQYPVTNRDAVGQGEFGVVCDFNLPTATEGHASFRVLAANGQHTGGDDQTANRNNSQLPNRIDTGQGGTADGGGQGGLDPVVLLPAVGLLLITLAAGLWLGQRTARRRW